MPETRIAWGSNWQLWDPGKVEFAWGTSWRLPSKVYVKANNAWRDTGFEAYPNPPTSFAINSWTYSTLSVKWSAPDAGGAPVSTYEIELRNSANTSTIAEKTDSSSPSANFSVSQDTKYYVRIRSKAASGLTSAWVYLKPWIGHPQVIDQQWVRKSRGYDSAAWYIGYRDATVGPTPTARYDANGLVDLGVYTRYAQLTYDISSWTSSLESATRFAYFKTGASGQIRLEGTYYGGIWPGAVSAWNVNWTDEWADGGKYGVYLTGSGWASGPATSQYHLDVYIRVVGTEYYGELEDYVAVEEQPNAYW
jgi:hypothetical protein